MTTAYKVAPNLHLISVPVPSSAPPAPPGGVNHVAVIDCSGSMGGDLPRIREQLKKKLPKLLHAGDTMSVVWFSGKTQFGVLLEAEPVASLKDLKDVNDAIDRWLKPVGMTGFKEPMEEVGRLVERVSKLRALGAGGASGSNPFALIFLSDGCDNQWDRSSVLKAVELAARGKAGQGPGLASATFVEYGYYADRPLLAAMAEKAGGSLIFSEDFDRYEPQFEAAISKRSAGGKRVSVAIQGDPVCGFAFALEGSGASGALTTYEASSGKVSVPEGLDLVWYVASAAPKGSTAQAPVVQALPRGEPAAYAALSLYATRMKSDVVFALLKATGDVTFIDQFSQCFGKQRYSDFMEATKAAAFDGKARYVQGYDPTRVPADDAFTVLDLFRVLSGDPGSKVLLDHASFKYSRISRGRVDADETLTAEEQQAVADLTAQVAAEALHGKNVKKLKELQAKLAAITASKKDALRFTADLADGQAGRPAGYPISSLTLNEDRPNISMLVRKPGTVDLTGRTDRPAGAPAEVSTHIWRNYAVVKDGLVNVEHLPLRMSAKTWAALRGDLPLVGSTVVHPDGSVDAIINLRKLPVINRKMVKEVSAKDLLTLEFKLTQARAEQKVFGSYAKALAPAERSAGMTEKYGADAAAWLKGMGITDGGFVPRRVQAPSTDVYMGKELLVALKGYASLPSVKEVKDRVAKLAQPAQATLPGVGKKSRGAAGGGAGAELTGCAALMAPAIAEAEAHAGDLKWLEAKADAVTATVRGLLYQAAQIKFATVVGNSWFSEFKSLDENSLVISCDVAGVQTDVTGTISMKEVEVKT